MPYARWVAIAAAGLLACAVAGPEAAVTRSALRRGDPEALPELAALPDVAPAQQTQRLQRGLSLARAVLQRGLPTPPVDRRYASLQAWIDQKVAPWIEARRESVEEARFQLGVSSQLAEPVSSAAEGSIAWGVVGLLEENTAHELSRIPSPAELETEPDIAEIFQELVATQAKPFRSAALLKYRKCYDLAKQAGSDTLDWAEFCGLRYERVHREL